MKNKLSAPIFLQLSILFLTLISCQIETSKALDRHKEGPHENLKEFQSKLPTHLKNLDLESVNWMAKDNYYWKKVLAPLQYRVTRESATERPFSGQYVHSKKSGIYICSSCGQELFRGETKFKSGTGWPSFYDVIRPKAVTLKTDRSLGVSRVEVICARCGAHLGHLFKDGPRPTGKRYCINSVSLGHLKKSNP